jgi:hypothetical protein
MFGRPDSRVEAIIELDGKQYRCHVVHLSFNGAVLWTDAPAGRGDTVEMDFEFVAGEQDLWVHVGGQVMAREERLLRVDFWEMDLDSLGDLRRIIAALGSDMEESEGAGGPSFTKRRSRHSRDGRLES